VGKIDRVFEGDTDIIITDGSSGNKWLKAVEGASEFLNWNLKQRIEKMKPLRKTRFYTGAFIGGLKEIKDGLAQDLDPREYNCAFALGFNGIFGKGHGVSDEKAVNRGLFLAVRYAYADINSKIRKDIQHYKE
jgi:glycerol-3-phosphate acyltransferase PlsX